MQRTMETVRELNAENEGLREQIASFDQRIANFQMEISSLQSRKGHKLAFLKENEEEMKKLFVETMAAQGIVVVFEEDALKALEGRTFVLNENCDFACNIGRRFIANEAPKGAAPILGKLLGGRQPFVGTMRPSTISLVKPIPEDLKYA